MSPREDDIATARHFLRLWQFYAEWIAELQHELRRAEADVELWKERAKAAQLCPVCGE